MFIGKGERFCEVMYKVDRLFCIIEKLKILVCIFKQAFSIICDL